MDEAHEDANIIFGSVIDSNIVDEVRITVIATGFDNYKEADAEPPMYVERKTTSQHQVPIQFVQQAQPAAPPPPPPSLREATPTAATPSSGARRERTVAPPRIEVPPATRAARVLGTRLSFEDEDFDTPTYQRRSQQHATSRE